MPGAPGSTASVVFQLFSDNAMSLKVDGSLEIGPRDDAFVINSAALSLTAGYHTIE